MTLIAPFILFLSTLTSNQASAFFCFGPDMITATMCVSQKMSAIAIMTKLEHDPRAGTWASEGDPGVNFVKREEKTLKVAEACLDLISCTAANAMAWAVAGSIPNPVKGDLGDFPSQIWYGAQLPNPGQSLDQLFDDKNPNISEYARSTPFFDQRGSSELLGSSPPGPGRTITSPGDSTGSVAAEAGGTVPATTTVGVTAGRQASGIASAPTTPTTEAMRDPEAPNTIRFEGSESTALDQSQASAAAGYGAGSGQTGDPDEIVGFMPSQGASAPELFTSAGVREGRSDGYSQSGAGPSTAGMTDSDPSAASRSDGARQSAASTLDAPN